jgi:hypothetical protein
MDTKLRAWWSHRQGLDGSLMGRSARDVLHQTGWSRSVGGASPYLTLFARAGLRRAEVDADLASLKIHELPSARGCTYVVPADDYPLALKVGQNFYAKAEIATAKKLGVTDAEVSKLRAAVLKALDAEPLDPDAVRAKVGNAARNLGPEGVKKGLTTTLPLALGLLQSEGEIRRLPVNGRIDRSAISMHDGNRILWRSGSSIWMRRSPNSPGTTIDGSARRPSANFSGSPDSASRPPNWRRTL